MAQSETAFDHATIKWNGAEWRTEGPMIQRYMVELEDGRFWFEVIHDYEPNGHDFRVVVWNFGLMTADAVGTRNDLRRRRFTDTEGGAARAKLEGFFLGPIDNPGLPNFPFRRAKSRCIGVNFPTGWITTL